MVSDGTLFLIIMGGGAAWVATFILEHVINLYRRMKSC